MNTHCQGYLLSISPHVIKTCLHAIAIAVPAALETLHNTGTRPSLPSEQCMFVTASPNESVARAKVLSSDVCVSRDQVRFEDRTIPYNIQ